MAISQAVKPDYWAVAVDVTEYYTIRPEHRSHVKAIKDVFIYDRNTRTYCCDSAPSHFLEYIYTTVEFRRRRS